MYTHNRYGHNIKAVNGDHSPLPHFGVFARPTAESVEPRALSYSWQGQGSCVYNDMYTLDHTGPLARSQVPRSRKVVKQQNKLIATFQITICVTG